MKNIPDVCIEVNDSEIEIEMNSFGDVSIYIDAERDSQCVRTNRVLKKEEMGELIKDLTKIYLEMS